MKKLLYLFILILPLGLLAQSYDDASEASELCLLIQDNDTGSEIQNSFINDVDAEVALDKILSVIGASKTFILQPCSDINNAVATSYKGLRYILYDKEFMNTIANNSNAWSQLFILAHEVGHHINGHSIDILLAANDIVKPKTLAAKRQQELESDEFAGFILGKLGASLEEISRTINLLASDKDDTYSSHPNKTKRLVAIRKGYDNALGNTPVVYETKTKKQTAEEYFYRALVNELNSNYDKAIYDYNNAIEIDPFYFNAYYRRALSKKEKKNYFGAIADLTKITDLNSSLSKPYEEIAQIYYLIGDYRSACNFYSLAIEQSKSSTKNIHDPTTFEESEIYLTFYNRSLSYIKLKMFEEALSDLISVNDLMPNYSNAYFQISTINIRLENYKEALKYLDKSIKLNPNIAKYYYNRAFVKDFLIDSLIKSDFSEQHQIKMIEAVITDYTKAIANNENYALAYRSRGVLKERIGDYNGACEDWNNAAKLGNTEVLSWLENECK